MNRYAKQTLFLISGSILALTGCSNNPISSSTNTNTEPETISSALVGKLAFENITQNSQTTSSISIENPAPANILTPPSIPSTQVNLAKRSALAKTLEGSIKIDSVHNTITFTSSKTVLGVVQSDTAVIALNSAALDNIENNETILIYRGAREYPSKIENYAIIDLDGDGVINGLSAHQQITISTTTKYLSATIGHKTGETELLQISVNAGADNNLQTEPDNGITMALWSRVIGSDTLAFVKYSDADGDGIISQNGVPSTIDIYIYESGNPFKPLVKYGKLTSRIVRAADGTEKAVRYAAEEMFYSGRLNKAWAVDSTGDSTISSGELAYLHLTTSSPSVTDTEVTTEVILVVDPGIDLGNTTDNILHEIHITKDNRIGIVRKLKIDFVANPPIPDGKAATGGTFELNAECINSKSVSLKGTFHESYLDATYTGPDGVATHLTINN
jgi:hypothetical protein